MSDQPKQSDDEPTREDEEVAALEAAADGESPEVDVEQREEPQQSVALREAAEAETKAGRGRSSRWRRLFSPESRLKRRLVRGILTFVIATTIGVLLLLYYAEDIRRYRAMARICSDDKQEQAQGAAYLMNHASEPQVLARAEAMLDDADGACFDRIVWALGEAGVWGSRFERAWPRYLCRRVDTVNNPMQRTYIAVQLGKLLWYRGPHHDDPRIPGAIGKLLRDEDANVRINALSAAAALPDKQKRIELIAIGLGDEEPEIVKHAFIMSGLLVKSDKSTLSVSEVRIPLPPQAQRAREWYDRVASTGELIPPEFTTPPADATDSVKRLAELESMATRSVESIEFTDDMPLLIRMHAVRVSKSATVDNMLPVFRAEAPTTRDVACLVALERFDQRQCHELAAKLAASFNDEQRLGGAILAGLAGPPPKSADVGSDRPSLADDPDAAFKVPEPTADDLRWWVDVRYNRTDDWVIKQHYLLTMWLWGEADPQFDPAVLLLKSKMPRTTTNLAMLHRGRLDGMDWMINPFGEPGVGGPDAFRLLLDVLRYHVVLRRYFSDLPEFWVWADEDTQRFQVDVIRDWYLLFRPTLKFDGASRTFTTEVTEGHRDK